MNGSIRLRRERSDKTDTFNKGNNGADFGAKIVKENTVGGVAALQRAQGPGDLPCLKTELAC